MGELKSITIAPELAAGIVAAQQAVRAVIKNGHNSQLGKSYATADDIAAAAKRALNEHGVAFVRIGVELVPPALKQFDLGAQGYAGDAIDRWILVHESGNGIEGAQSLPVIVSKGRPHEKAVSATLTYGFGVALRGLLCMEREERGNAVDDRSDYDDGSDIGPPVCTKAQTKECTDLCYELAAARSTNGRIVHHHDVFAAAWTGVALQPDGDANPTNMTPAEAALIIAWLRATKAKLARISASATGDEGAS